MLQVLPADANSEEALKSAYTKGMKKDCELQVKPLLGSTLRQEQVMSNYMMSHSPIGTPEPMRNMLNEVRLLSPKGIEYITKPPIASNVLYDPLLFLLIYLDHIGLYKTLSYHSYSLCCFTLLIYIYLFTLLCVSILLLLPCFWVLSIYPFIKHYTIVILS